MTAAAFLLAIIKAVPAAEQVMQQLVDLYVAWKRNQNAHETKVKDARDDAVIDALAAKRMPLCASCPYSVLGGGQHAAADAAPAVQGSSPSRT